MHYNAFKIRNNEFGSALDRTKLRPGQVFAKFKAGGQVKPGGQGQGHIYQKVVAE